MAAGTLSRKMNRQPPDPVANSKPPAKGPIAVVMPASPDHRPMARPRCSATNKEEIRARLPGTISAAPTPCSARAAISASAVGASPHNRDATRNPATPQANTRRIPSRSASAPPTRTNDPSVSR